MTNNDKKNSSESPDSTKRMTGINPRTGEPFGLTAETLAKADHPLITRGFLLLSRPASSGFANGMLAPMEVVKALNLGGLGAESEPSKPPPPENPESLGDKGGTEH